MATVRAAGAPDPPIRTLVATSSSGRRRRPSGEPPPLPRHVATATRVYGLLVALALALEAAMAVRLVRARVTQIDLLLLEWVERLRADFLVEPLDALVSAAAQWPARVLFWATLVALLLVRRMHHLVAYLLVMLGSSLLLAGLAVGLGRMRPGPIEVVGRWEGYAHPSLPVALLALALVGVLRTLLPAGPLRRRATWGAAAVVVVIALARVYLGVDHPSDVLVALALGWALPMAFFDLALPDESFPVRYRAGTRAHVEVTGARGTAVLTALEQQLGLRAVSLEPFGLAGSAGSMPLRIFLADEKRDQRAVFGKLYTVVHLRSDRWYKLARMVLYGRLEDEKPFSTVRRLVEYEDHMLRLLRDSGLPVPAPYGFVEITPEREYVIVMELFAGAQEVGQEQLTTREIDDGLRVVRRLWEAGVAHRDVKPSNLLARDGRILLIDVAFATVRPTPWRQAVDLANMMLTLALGSTAEEVYERALLQFAPDDVAEAFAASRSITLPTQLRARLRADGRDLPRRFRELAPERAPVSIQLWGVRRVLVTLSVVLGAALTLALLATYARVANLL